MTKKPWISFYRVWGWVFATSAATLASALLFIIAIAIAQADAPTSSGFHGAGSPILPEGASTTIPSPPAACEDYRTDDTVATTVGCDPAVDVWEPSNDSTLHVFTPSRASTRTYLPDCYDHPDGDPVNYVNNPWEDCWQTGSVDNNDQYVMRVPFDPVSPGASLYFDCEAAPAGAGGDSWTSLTLVLTDDPTSTTAYQADGCEFTGTNAAITVYNADDYVNHPLEDVYNQLYCMVDPPLVFYVQCIPTDAACGGAKTCRALMTNVGINSNTIFVNGIPIGDQIYHAYPANSPLMPNDF